MSDIYGNLTTQEHVVRFTTDAAAPQAGFQMPYQASVMQEDGPQQFYITYRNVESVDVKLSSITPSQFMSFLNGNLQREEYYPSAENLVWETLEYNSGQLNERVLKPLQHNSGYARYSPSMANVPFNSFTCCGECQSNLQEHNQ
jgi:hypothetical protein